MAAKKGLEVDEEEADRQAEEASKQPFEPADFSTPWGEGFSVLPCPTKLPHDLEVGQRMAQWFGPPYNAWYVGKIAEINRRRTRSENVSVEFNDETDGETRGLMVADAETYGADRLWCMLKPIPIELDDDDDDSSEPPELPPELPTSDEDAAARTIN